MAEKRREIQMLYSHDRLSDEKISQIYRMLVPEKIWKNGVAQGDTHEGVVLHPPIPGSRINKILLRIFKGETVLIFKPG